MNKIATALLTVAMGLGASIGAVTLAPAAIAATTGPILTSPANGSSVPEGFTGPITLDLSNIPEGTTLRMELTCPAQGGVVDAHDVTYSSDPDSFEVAPLDGAQDCVASSAPSEGGEFTEFGRFSVVAPQQPALSLSSATISATAFYPLVRDGYRDNVSLRWNTNRAAATSVSVLNRAGSRVRTAGLGRGRTRGCGTAGSPAGAWRRQARTASGSPHRRAA